MYTNFKSDETQIRELYQRFIEGWNNRSADAMTEPFVEEGEMIGFDGSQYIGREEMFSNLQQIFAHHPTAPYVVKVTAVRSLGSEGAVLRAIAGMVPPGKSEINPNVNSHHTLVAVKKDGKWLIELFQNTPAQFHGRPDLVENMTEELQNLL
ncbi:MAG: SgcJ/EcaC family oxidoreductase [Neobacillus sp.]